MMIPIIKWTLRQRRWSIFWWSVGVFAFISITMVFYPTFKSAAGTLEKSFASLPKAAVGLFGGSSDFFSPIGYLNSQIFFLMWPLLLSMLSVTLGSSLIAREEQDMTIELLLARPVSRSRLMTAKIAAGTIIMLVVAAVGSATIIVSTKIFNVNVPLGYVAQACIGTFLLAYTTGAVSFLLAATGRARNAAVGIGAAIGIAGYLITSLAGTVHWLRTPAKALPFNYYQSVNILSGTYHWLSALFFVAVIFVCGVLSYLVFRRRDIA